MKFRNLRADEIECRVQSVGEKGINVLLYKTARTDANILDEEVRPENWSNDFKIVDGVLYGAISIKTDGEWVTKWDAGTESNNDAEKGRASDAFKRAGFKWGIGRNLYSAPFIFVPKGKCNVIELKDKDGNPIKDKKGKVKRVCYDKFHVKQIGYDEETGDINQLEIYNDKLKKVCYSLGEESKEEIPLKRPADSAVMAKLKLAGFEKNWKELLKVNYGVEKLNELTDEQMRDCEARCDAEIKKKKEAEQEQIELVQASNEIQGTYANE